MSVIYLKNHRQCRLRNSRQRKWLMTAKKVFDSKNSGTIEKYMIEIESTFRNYEIRSRHPYIYCQKARIYQLFLKGNADNKSIPRIINDNFERMVYLIHYDYKYIKNTYSFASILWIYGSFLNRELEDYSSAIKYLDEARMIYNKFGKFDRNYYKMMRELYISYFARFKTTLIKEYLIKAKEVYHWLEENKGISEYNIDTFLLHAKSELKVSNFK